MSSRWRSSNANSSAWKAQRLRVLARDGHRCQMQGPRCTGRATTVDHLVPWAPGQQTPDSALQSACGPCNFGAGSPEKRNPEVPRPSWL